MNKYVYDGSVMEFDRCISDNWHGETFAVSEKKARINLAYQYKKQHNRTARTNITLPGKIKMVV